MYTLDKPAMPVGDILTQCIGAAADPDLESRLEAIRPAIEGGTAIYEAHVAAATLHVLPRPGSIGAVSKEELMALYSDNLSATRGAARPTYNAIKNAAPNKLCPLCSIGSVAHLDHHLPKSKYLCFSILPVNLVPACHFCNDTKKARFPATAGEQTFNPYYDGHLLQDQWVVASLDPGPPPVLVFTANAPLTWPATDRERVARHFIVCGLATTFTTNANSLLSSLKARLTPLFVRGGAAEVRAYLADERDAHAAKPNSWQFACYQALEADAWFVGGGFQTIP